VFIDRLQKDYELADVSRSVLRMIQSALRHPDLRDQLMNFFV
jgi:hypothetical protein